jgi:putative heme-binding domain-containing protein
MFFARSFGCGVVFAMASAHAVPPDFEIHTFAGDPDVSYPTALSAAANGDVYVSSDPNGSLGHDKTFGKVVRCRDTDGDGKADAFTDFVPLLASPRGGHFLRNTLYIIHPPYLSAFTDKDADGVSDEHKVLVTGFGWGIEHPRGADHTTNGVRMGIDGWLYVAVGDFGMPKAKTASGVEYTLYGGGVVRVRPDGSEMEPYALYCRNICDVAISPRLDMFARDNTNDGKGWNTRLHHFVNFANHGYPRFYHNFQEEMVAPLADYGGGSGTGGLWLSEPNFPAEFNNMLYTCDWTTGKFHGHPMREFEATFVTEQTIFHDCPRATDIDVDGSQRLYLADWRNGKFAYAGKGVAVGMVQQATLKNHKTVAFPDLDKMKDKELANVMTSPSAVARLECQRALIERGPKPIFETALRGFMKDKGLSVEARIAAIFTYKQLFGAKANPALVALTTDATVREFTLRALADRKQELANVPSAPFVAALKDPNPRVQLQALIGLGRLGKRDNAPAILAAAATFQRDVSKLNNGKPSGKNEHYILPHIATQVLIALQADVECLAAMKTPALRPTAVLALRQMHTKAAVQGLINIISQTKENALRFDAMATLSRLMFTEKPWDLQSWWHTRPDDRGPYFEPILWSESDQIKDALEKHFTDCNEAERKALVEIFAKNRIPLAKLKLAGVDPVVLALGATEIDAATAALLISGALDAARPWSVRQNCYKALYRDPLKASTHRLDVLAAWSEDSNIDPAAQQHINDFVNETARGNEVGMLQEIGKKSSDAAARIAWKSLLTVLQSPLAKEPTKQQVRKRVEQNPQEVGFFLALADMKLAGFDKQIEAGLSFDNKKTIDAAKAAQVAIATAQAATVGKRVAELPVAEVTKFALEAKGDATRGAKLYETQGCIACHSVEPAAEQKGPYLGAAGAKFRRDYLIESILEPGKVVAQGFQTTILQLKDGSTKMGFITDELDGNITMRDISGAVATIKRDDVKEEQHPDMSMMPAGLAAGLSTKEFADLVEYLVSLKQQGG